MFYPCASVPIFLDETKIVLISLKALWSFFSDWHWRQTTFIRRDVGFSEDDKNAFIAARFCFPVASVKFQSNWLTQKLKTTQKEGLTALKNKI